MDLLGQENNTPKPKSKGKKMVLNLLILSIVLLVVVIALMYVVKKNQPLKPTLYVNNESKPVISDLIIDNAEDGKKYVSLKDVSALIGYQYLGGEYPEYKEISTKGYFQNSNQIIGFELGSNKIYKTVPDTNTDFQYYDIKNKIIQKNDKLYIELQDFNETCQAIADYSSEKNQTTITTGDSLMTQWERKIIEAGTYKSVSKDFENQKALFQGLIVVGTSEKNDGNYGVIDTNMKEIITPKFKEMKFDEYTKNFIVKGSDNQYGVISKDGKEIIVEVKYDSVRIINYNPVLYEVKLNNKYGVINEKGKIIANTEYDKIGYDGDKTKETKAVLVIKEVYENKDGIVVSKNNGYGIISLETGREIVPPVKEVSKIYAKTNSKNENEYFVEFNGQEAELSKYAEYVNTISVNVQNNTQTGESTNNN